jgi:hypothetical protein
MRLEDCVLNFDLVMTAPLQRTEPEQEWVRAHSSKVIPASLYDLYCRANYLSFGAVSSFLQDDDNVLFSYFGMLMRSQMEAFADADEQLRLFIEAQIRTYDLGKKARGESWDSEADGRARRRFRDSLISLQGGLDALADLIALFFTGLIPDLRLGRAQFSRIERWLDRPLPAGGLVLTPSEHHVRRLYDTLRPLVYPSQPEHDWLPLMRLFRNKGAHLGSAMFRYVGLHDESFHFYTFIPRQWPYIWERYMKRREANRPADPDFLPTLLRKTLVHQDIITYAQSLQAKVHDVVHGGVSVLIEAYEQFKDFPVNQAALAELQGSSESYDFECFLGSQGGGYVP